MDTANDFIFDSLCDHVFPLVEHLLGEALNSDVIVQCIIDDFNLARSTAERVYEAYEVNNVKQS
tara:strand:- start:2434 stop:2625 length:192 start_codon:yes stop_codon:yes gene_type:complete